MCMVAGLPPQPDLAAIKELEAVREAYTARPDNPRYRFNHLFLNVVDNPASRVKPNGRSSCCAASKPSVPQAAFATHTLWK